MNLQVGDMVVLIWTDGHTPPIGSIGEIIGFDLTGGVFDWSVIFPGYPCPTLDGEDWLIQPSWLVRLNPPAVAATTKARRKVRT